jgi:hypothetical protein
MVVQRRMIATKDKIRSGLERIVVTTPKSIEKLSTQELLMRRFVDMDERARYDAKGVRGGNVVHGVHQPSFQGELSR